jgi:integrase
MHLTTKRVELLKKRPGRHSDGAGLYLQVFSPNSASWFLRYQRHGRERWLGLGSAAVFTLAQARGRALRARMLLADGIDPLDQKRAALHQEKLKAAKARTFADVAQEYFNAHESSWTNAAHRRQFTATMRDYVNPVIGSLPVAAVDEPMVLGVLRPIRRDKTTTAKRIRNRIASVIDYASAAGYRSGSNPARWEGHLEHLLPQPEKIAAVKHHAALPYSEVGGFMARLRATSGVAARALEFLILTAARRGEVIGARWNEIDWEGKVWTVPAERMKTGQQHRVPLAPDAMKLLADLPREADNPHIFVGSRTGSAIGVNAMYHACLTLDKSVTVHGFRSTFRDWAAERTNYANHVVEMALAHSIGSAVEASYRRGDLLDQRRQLMLAWAKYCDTPSHTKAGDVVPIRSAPR